MAKTKRTKSAARAVQKVSAARKLTPSKISAAKKISPRKQSPAAKKTSPRKQSPATKKISTRKLVQRSRVMHSTSRRAQAQVPVHAVAETEHKKRRFRPGTRALMEIRQYQKSTELLIPRKSFSRLVRNTMKSLTISYIRIQPKALLALQEAAESFLVMYLKSSLMAQIHACRKTLMKKDLIFSCKHSLPE